MEIQSRILRDLNGNMVSLSFQSADDDGDNQLKRQNIACASKIRAIEEYKFSGTTIIGDPNQVHGIRLETDVLNKYHVNMYPEYHELIDIRQYLSLDNQTMAARLVQENTERVQRYLQLDCEYHGYCEEHDNFSA